MAKKRTVSKKQSKTIVAVLTIGMLALTAIIGLTGVDLGSLAPDSSVTKESPNQVPPTLPSNGSPSTNQNAPSSASWWDVYFAEPLTINDPANWQGSIEGKLIDRINAAQTSIHIASFEFDLTPVAEALIAAHDRGVDVRWVTDDEHGLEADEEPGHGQFKMLEDAGIEVKDDGRGALMHDKFWIFDGKTVWTGSTNITVNGIYKQNNNVIVIQSAETAAIYEREFDEMWAGEFGPRSTSTVDQQSVVVNNTPIQVLFASEDDVIDHLLPYIEGAQSNIRFLAFSYTHDSLGDAMLARAKDGVDVSGVFETVGSETEYAELTKMYCAKIPVRQDGNPSFLHHKYIVVDDHIVITGSLNFSESADDSNDENVVVIDNADIARLYVEEFQRVWDIGHDPDPGDLKCGK